MAAAKCSRSYRHWRHLQAVHRLRAACWRPAACRPAVRWLPPACRQRPRTRLASLTGSKRRLVLAHRVPRPARLAMAGRDQQAHQRLVERPLLSAVRHQPLVAPHLQLVEQLLPLAPAHRRSPRCRRRQQHWLLCQRPRPRRQRAVLRQCPQPPRRRLVRPRPKRRPMALRRLLPVPRPKPHLPGLPRQLRLPPQQHQQLPHQTMRRLPHRQP